MRYLFGFLCVCALSVVPLVGYAQNGGGGGAGGSAGTGGTGGVVGDCTGVEDFTDCMFGDLLGGCLNGACRAVECDGVDDEVPCILFGFGFVFPGACSSDSCLPECEVLEDGSACTLGDERGVCANGSCEARCEYDADCDFDGSDCTTETCLNNGLCEEGGPVEDTTPCAGGTCQGGACVLESSVLPCAEQGIRNAIAAGGGPYTFDCQGQITVAPRAPIAIDRDVILNGEGNLTIDGLDSLPPQRPDGDDPSVFYVTPGVTADLHGFAITDSHFRAIINAGTLTLVNSVVSGNPGGGVHNEEAATLTVTGVTVSDNECSEACDGAGFYNEGVLTLTASTVSGNRSRGGGGGILNWDANGQGEGTMTIVNTTISGNRAGAEGGGISNDSGGTLAMTNCTIAGNTSDEQQGSLSNIGSLMLSNTLVDGDCEGVLTSNGYNIESPANTCGFDQTGDQPGITAEQLNLGELADNGGPTRTHALGEGSVAIDVIPAEECLDHEGSLLTMDQRGFARDSTCDVGAYEVGAQEPQPPESSEGCGCTVVQREDAVGVWLLAIVMLVGIRRVCRGTGS